MRKVVTYSAAVVLIAQLMFSLVGCGTTATHQNVLDTKTATESILASQPTPTDLDFSLERFNLIRRAYWVNGQHAKANAVPCNVDRPIGYIVLITESGAVLGTYTVDGKVSSLNSYLSADSEKYATSTYAEWLADVDGSYGENVEGIFWFTVDGHYMEWNGTYLYSDIPFNVENPVIQIKPAE